MDKKYLEIAVIAAKSIFIRGSVFVRFRRLFILIALPLYASYGIAIESNLYEIWSYQDPIVEIILTFPISLLILLTIYWFWQLFLCVGFKNDEKIRMNDEEITYVKFSLILFVYFIFIVDYNFRFLSNLFRWEYRNIIDLVSYTLYGLTSLGFTILGTYLTIKARNKIPVFLDLMLTTFCIAISFVNVFMEFISGH